MNTIAPADLKQLSALLRQGEGPVQEFKCLTRVGTFNALAGSSRAESLRVEMRRLWPDVGVAVWEDKEFKSRYRLTTASQNVSGE